MPTPNTSPPLLETKFNPATSAATVVERQCLRIPTALRDGRAKAAAISAPAGYGKSTVIAAWRQQFMGSGVRVAWLNLDENDNDPARFMRYLRGALQRGDILAEQAESPSTLHQDATLLTLEHLAVDLGALDCRACLFLDDIHLIDNDDVRNTVQWLGHYAPENFQLVLSGRNIADISLSRLRVRRRLVEIDCHALKFQENEVAPFFHSRGIAELGPTEISLLLQRTEGWPAGLELAAIMLENASDRAELVKAFAGNEQNLMDYLGEVFLDTLTPETRSFLFAIAQFRRINGPLAELVTGTENGQQQLESLYRGNFFLSRLDNHGEWFRFHQLIRDFLCQRGQRDEPERCRSALLRGARYYADQGHFYEAIQCAIRAQAWDTASRYLADNAESLTLGQGYLQSLISWMEKLPTEWADRYPSIRVNYALALTFFGRHREAWSHIRRLEELHKQLLAVAHPDHEQARELDCSIGVLRSFYYALTDQREETLTESERWLKAWPDAPEDQRRGISNAYTFALKSCGRLDEALEMSNQVQSWVPSNSVGIYPYSWFFVLRCYLFLKRGDYVAAQSTAETGLNTIRRIAGRGGWLNSGNLLAILAMVHYEFGNLDLAAECLEQSTSEDDEYNQADAIIIRYLTQARLHRARNDTEQGLQTLRHGRAISDRLALVRPAMALAAEEITWLARDGKLTEAQQLAQPLGLAHIPSDGQNDLMSQKCLHTASRCHMADRPTDAALALQLGIAHCREAGLNHRLAEFLVLKALAWNTAGEEARAIKALTDAVVLCAQLGYERVIRDEGPAIQALLQKLPIDKSEGAATALLQRLRRDNSAPNNGATASANSALIEPLTKRELQILGRLQSDLSNREIAEAIFVSEGTLKWHLHNIYGKLGVRTRTGALSRAVELDLV